MFKKKAIVTLNTFVLLLILYLMIFLSAYVFYSNSKETVSNELKKHESLNSALSFRSALLDVVAVNGSNLSYVNSYGKGGIRIYLTNKTITAKEISDNKLVQINISSLGINFCSNFSFYPVYGTLIVHNGSCIFLVTK